MADRSLVMSDGPGRIVEEIDVDLPGPRQPARPRATPRADEYVTHLFHALHIDNRLDA